jgi:hypothetical protein
LIWKGLKQVLRRRRRKVKFKIVMKILVRLNLLLICVIALYSCSERRAMDGDWDDCIKLSVKTVEFSPLADSVTVTTGGSWWWITDVAVNGNDFYGFTDVDLTADSYVIKQDCFIVERRDKNTLVIKVEANPLNEQRVISVGLEAGDYFDRVIITQRAK